MNILQWIVLIALLLFALNGMRKGLVRTVFSTFTMLIAIILATSFSPKFSKIVQSTPLHDSIASGIQSSLFDELDTAVGTTVSEQTAIICELPLPSSIQDALLENNNSQIYDALGITAFEEYVSAYLACLIINALSMVFVFALAIILLNFIAIALDIVSYLPVLHTLNKLGGFIIGLINGLVIVWVLCIVLILFSSSSVGSYLYTQINSSLLLRIIYNNNLLLMAVTSLKNLLI